MKKTRPLMAKPKHKKTILVADDEKSLVRIYATSLAKEGFEVLKAYDGVQAMQIAINEHPDLILLDIMMPEKDGYEVLQELKALPKTKDIPVILFTNLGMEHEVKRGRKLGAVKFLIKADIDLDEMIKEVNNTLESSG